MMKKVKLIFVFSLISLTAWSQTWSGATPGNIYYNQGSVGIGTTSPSEKLHVVAGNSSGLLRALTLENDNSTEGSTAVGIGFLASAGTQKKGLLAFQRTTGNGRGDFIFAINNTNDGSDATLSDEVMRIARQGNVGIGTSTPDASLDVIEATANSHASIFRFNSTTLSTSNTYGIHLVNSDLSQNSIGGIKFSLYDDGNTTRNAAWIAAGKDQLWSAGNQNTFSSYLVFGTRRGPSGGITEAMRIDSDGNVGIGTSSPNNRQHIVASSNNDGLLIERDNSDDNTYAGILFKNALNDDDLYKKGALYFEKTAGSGRGKFHFALEGTNDNSNVDISDAVMSINHDGKVGIGTTNPSELLEVSGNIKLNTNDGDLIFGSAAAHIKESSNSIEFISHASLRFYIDEYNNSTDDKFQIFGNATEGTLTGAAFTVEENGNVGIGTDNPDEKLTVKGTIHTEEVKVDLNVPGPDYVFEPDYDLRTLEETKEYIEENKHLPEIPSAKEMEANGIDIGEMNMLLLKKIEEMTLHQIELMERLEKAEQEIASMKKK